VIQCMFNVCQFMFLPEHVYIAIYLNLLFGPCLDFEAARPKAGPAMAEPTRPPPPTGGDPFAGNNDGGGFADFSAFDSQE